MITAERAEELKEVVEAIKNDTLPCIDKKHVRKYTRDSEEIEKLIMDAAPHGRKIRKHEIDRDEFQNEVCSKYGDMRRFAEAVGYNYQTVYAWTRKGYIPWNAWVYVSEELEKKEVRYADV